MRERAGRALGAAMFGAVAAGKARGGYDTIAEAAERMASLGFGLQNQSKTLNYNRLYQGIKYCTTISGAAERCAKALARAEKCSQNKNM